jgi:membrane associated rhomboid family serine protease
LACSPDLVHYGLSGVLHGGVACVGWQLLAHERGRRRRAIGALILAGLALKVASEAPWGAPLRHPPGWDIATAPFAHASGLVAGLVAALLCDVLARARRAGRAAPRGSL